MRGGPGAKVLTGLLRTESRRAFYNLRMLNVLGRPWVLAFVKAWQPVAQELDMMRAQLRGLGAVLVVFSGNGEWSFRPDDELERFESGTEIDRRIAQAADRYSIEDGCDAVLVFDEDGHVRFEYVTEGPLRITLADALAAAGDTIVAKKPPLLFSRREWALTSLCSGLALALFGCKSGKHEDKPVTPATPVAPKQPGPPEYDIVLDVNGTQQKLRIDARVSLLDALRERLGLTGTKKGCDHGQCGACTVHADGRRILSCMTLAIMAQGQKLTTIEGLAQGDTLHPVQQAFIAHDGFQCGYCTPGQIMSAAALLKEGHTKSDDEIREWMSGNLCRCGAYPNIVTAIRTAAKGA
jgi:xanthine dehydrogenase YagT iron-sulfur-binding subunit